MQNEAILSIIGYILAGVGSLFIFIGGLIAYIFRQHIKDNGNMFQNNREDHIRIHERIDELKGKKRGFNYEADKRN